MIGDQLIYHTSYQPITQWFFEAYAPLFFSDKRCCIAVSGESGCGKTSLAVALKTDLERVLDLKSYIFHLDDYFKLPPRDNHNRRLTEPGCVGPQEVHLAVLDMHLEQFKKGNMFVKPLVNYVSNTIMEETIAPTDFDCCIVEGTYTSLLQQPDVKIFIEKTYHDTLSDRQKRARDVMNTFNEQVLEIEHRIIKKHRELADIIVSKTLQITKK